MLQLLKVAKWPSLAHRRVPTPNIAHFRCMASEPKKPDDSKKCKKEGKANKADSKEKDHTKISGGSKCTSKKRSELGSPNEDKNADQKLCEKLIVRREEAKEKAKEMAEKKAQQKEKEKEKGGAVCASSPVSPPPKCPCKPCPEPQPCDGHSKIWQRITLMGAFPIVVILTAFVFSSHHEAERPEFKQWSHLYLRTKPFYFGDGIRSQFHNSYWNPLPPDGYEDEIDLEALGKKPESEQEKAERLKEFDSLNKKWKKHNKNREAEAKKRQAAAEKEAKKQEKLAMQEEKKQQAEEAKELKRQMAEAKRQDAAVEKERKRLEAEAEKDRKQQLAFSEKERKRQEAEDKEAAKEVKEMYYNFNRNGAADAGVQD
ncbi:axoneme-associated protein mst101(2) isoform X2 [Drosophila hydei]|uniref:Axoneme-associated protein mst101(2) isoform X2 n=1 Tax=Drosophila hydei TaxID=7224 RepID=A0A6J1M2F4_DROHY|nr:axoneme-associated protein mst101(2) isoform X2 [Drosophila hydei]